ncbi:MAG: Plug domain-containing protein, partial [Rikenellaceae bacterium]
MLVTAMTVLSAMGGYAQDGLSSENLTNNQITFGTSVEKDSMTRYADEIVVTGTRTPRKLKESPVPIAVLTATDLRNGNILTLEDALIKLNPSFSVMTNGMGTTMSLNGLPDDYMLFLLNGRRMIGSNPYAQIDINRVKRIEIMPGAA